MSELPKQLDAIVVAHVILDGNLIDRDEDDTNLFERMDHALTTRYNAHEVLEARMKELEAENKLMLDLLRCVKREQEAMDKAGYNYAYTLDLIRAKLLVVDTALQHAEQPTTAQEEGAPPDA